MRVGALVALFAIPSFSKINATVLFEKILFFLGRSKRQTRIPRPSTFVRGHFVIGHSVVVLVARTVVVVVRVSTLATVAVALARLATGIRMTRLILFQHSFAHIVVAAEKTSVITQKGNTIREQSGHIGACMNQEQQNKHLRLELRGFGQTTTKTHPLFATWKKIECEFVLVVVLRISLKRRKIKQQARARPPVLTTQFVSSFVSPSALNIGTQPLPPFEESGTCFLFRQTRKDLVTERVLELAVVAPAAFTTAVAVGAADFRGHVQIGGAAHSSVLLMLFLLLQITIERQHPCRVCRVRRVCRVCRVHHVCHVCRVLGRVFRTVATIVVVLTVIFAAVLVVSGALARRSFVVVAVVVAVFVVVVLTVIFTAVLVVSGALARRSFVVVVVAVVAVVAVVVVVAVAVLAVAALVAVASRFLDLLVLPVAVLAVAALVAVASRFFGLLVLPVAVSAVAALVAVALHV
jgi:hypothetical protein